MTSPTDDNAAAYQASREQLIAARVVELVAAMFWGVVYFGIIGPVVVPEDVPIFQLYPLRRPGGKVVPVVPVTVGPLPR